MRSLRFRLTVAVLAVVTCVLVVFSLALHAAMARALWRDLDEQLAGDAAAVAGMVEEGTATTPWEFEYASLPDFERPIRPAYFQVWGDDGRPLARSPSLGGGDLARARAGLALPRPFDVALPDGRRGRAVEIQQPGRSEDASPAARPSGAAGRRLATVVVARGTEGVDSALVRIRFWLAGLGVLVLAGALLAGVAAVSRSLWPVRALTSEIVAMDASRLGHPLSLAHLPRELAPMVGKLNELLDRLRSSFARERMFTADVSHELRTPLAALRTTMEVARSRERSPEDYRRAIDEAYAVIRHMHRLVEDLLMLARLDARQAEVRREEIRLSDLVAECWRPIEGHARSRRLLFSNEIAQDATVVSDRDKLRVVVTNLLTNAADYTDEGGSIAVRGGQAGTVIEVRDSGPRIADELLPHLFERFTRGDSSRSGGVHCGIGLALVKSISELLDLSVTAANAPDGAVSFRLVARSER